MIIAYTKKPFANVPPWLIAYILVIVPSVFATKQLFAIYRPSPTGLRMLRVDTDIPAGNALITAVEGDTIHLRPDNRDSTEDWFYWHIRVRDCAHRRITLQFDRPCTMTVRGAAVSRDQGATWSWVPEYTPHDLHLHYACGDANDIRFCLAFPYTRANLDAWLTPHRNSPHLRVHHLCQTPKGRSVPWLEIGCLDGAESHQVLLSARHHACEMMANYVLEGLMDALLDNPSAALRLRLLVVPLVDFDGVEDGDQGKARHPHDHNRDYGDAPLYPETRAIMNLVQTHTDTRLRHALDLHCPFVVGDDFNHQLYLVGNPFPNSWRRQKRFANTLQKCVRGPLPYDSADTLPYGEKWNTDANYTNGTTAAKWIHQARSDSVMATTLEIPYATAKGVPVTPHSARAFGQDLLHALLASQ